MIRITSFSRRTHTTMASTTSLLILLLIASPMLTISEKLPEMFPSEPAQGNHFREQIKRSCPPFGNPDERFSVKVLGTTSPVIGGCASMVPPNSDILQSFNLWLGNHKTVDGGKCGDKNMDHFMFDCMAKHPFFTDEDTLEGWYVMLYDRMARWSGRQDYRCALYETVKEDPPLINMVISANQSCHGLLKRIEQPEHTVPKGLRHFSDGSVALQFNKDLPQKRVRRKIQSEVESGGYRKKRELVIEEDRIKKGINNRKKRCYYPNQRDELKRIERGESIYVNKIGQKYPDSLNKTATTPSKVVQ